MPRPPRKETTTTRKTTPLHHWSPIDIVIWYQSVILDRDLRLIVVGSAHSRVYLQVHCPLGQAHEVPQEQEQPGAVRVLVCLLQQREGVMEGRRG